MLNKHNLEKRFLFKLGSNTGRPTLGQDLSETLTDHRGTEQSRWTLGPQQRPLQPSPDERAFVHFFVFFKKYLGSWRITDPRTVRFRSF